MKKQILLFLVWILAFSLLAVGASADTGPKPSVRITFENMGDEVCYGTLLSESSSTGPASAWNGEGSYGYDNGLSREVWKAFAEYEDADGYFFLQWFWLCSESKTLDWNYYPPSPFKILLYYPDTDTFAVSGICERYAFDSYFTVNMDGMRIDRTDTQNVLLPQKSYDYTGELISFVCRVVFTILLEVGIACLFGFRQKKLLWLIALVNTATQIALNVLLNITNCYRGAWGVIAVYIPLEFAVFTVEAVVFILLFGKVSTKPVPPIKIILYALVSNTFSFFAGFALARLIPQMF